MRIGTIRPRCLLPLLRYALRPSLLPWLLLAAGPASAEPLVLTLTTTTSTESTGLLGWLNPIFEREHGIAIKVVARGTGAALQLARDGNADVVLAHAPALEEQFMADGHGLTRLPVMYNDFVILGPHADPAGVRSCPDATCAMERIAARGAVFVSRGDASGTHVKEQELWQATTLRLVDQGISLPGQAITGASGPDGAWYRAIGRGMGPTISYATELQAYTLSDRGTYDAFAYDTPPRTDLEVLSAGDARLMNPYSIIVISPAKHPLVHAEQAQAYADWLCSPQTQRRIADFQVGGRTLFHPGAPPALPPTQP